MRTESSDNLEILTVESLIQELENAKDSKNKLKIELLRHYLLNFILYSNLSEDEKSDSPIKEKLLRISILLEKLVQMEGKLSNVDAKRIVEDRMIKRKSNSHNSKTTTPGKKFRINSENLKERTKTKDDFNIKFKKESKK